MEPVVTRPVYRRPPLPCKRDPLQDSDTTNDSPHGDGKPELKHAKPAILPPINRFNSIKCINSRSTRRDTSIDEGRYKSRDSSSSNTSVRSLPRSARSLKTRKNSQQSLDSLEDEVKRFIPQVSAHSWIAFEMNKMKFIHGKRIHRRREIASLTKIMNLITAIDTLERLGLDPRRVVVRVSKEASSVRGTTAQLKPGMQLTIYDLMFGMMLPSGNDAAFAMAQTVGALLSETNLQKKCVYDVDQLDELVSRKSKPVLTFLDEMNKVARSLEMNNSKFTNPHGLSQITNLSTAQDLSKLCSYAMRNKSFFQIINAKQHTATYTIYNDTQSLDTSSSYLITWNNTNKMLWQQGWNGVKTGVTPNAGPCLAASLQRTVNGQHYHILIILICASSMDIRWKEVQQIGNWVFSEKIY